MRDKLKPCPFCGSQSIEVHETAYGSFLVTCIQCHVRSDTFSLKEEAIAYWNRRANEPEEPDEFKSLKPCPICGGKVEVIYGAHSGVRLECTKCHCFLLRWNGEADESIKEYWNSYDALAKRAPAIQSCPICGTAAVYWCKDGKYYVSCDNVDCNFQTPAMNSQQEAADVWNGEVKNG